MSRWERHGGQRDMSYSRWHRLQERWLGMIDLDWVDYCRDCDEPLALTETVVDVGQNMKCTGVTLRLAERAGLPAYLVFYRPSSDGLIDQVRVRRLRPLPTEERVLTPDKWRLCLLALHGMHKDRCPQTEVSVDQNERR